MREGSLGFVISALRAGPLTLVCVLVFMTLGCSLGPGHTATPDRATSTTTAQSPLISRVPGEPAAGIALVRKNGFLPDEAVPGGDGSLLLSYTDYGSRGGCYYRRVARDGTVSGWLTPRRSCRVLYGHGEGVLGLDAGNPLHGALDLSVPGHPKAVAVDDPVRTPEAGDRNLGWCGDLSEDDKVGYSRQADKRGCAYSPRGRTLYRLRPALTIDPAGRVWTGGPGRTLLVSQDSATRWLPSALAIPDAPHIRFRFPREPVAVVGSAVNTAAAWVEGGDGYLMYATGNVGRSWHLVQSPPDQVRNPDVTVMLPNGRLLLGPGNGQIFRATDATNTSFDAIEAGPITTVFGAGDCLFGRSESTDPTLASAVWTSQDSGSTWRQVLGIQGVTPHSTPVPADQLQVESQPEAAALFRRVPLTEFAVNSRGLVLVIHARDDGGGTDGKSAWRLYDQQDKVIVDGLDSSSVHAAGNGFLFYSAKGLQFVDESGKPARVDVRETGARPVKAGDVFVPNLGVYRPGRQIVFNGKAAPDGIVSAVDNGGRMWALGRDAPGRVVVRSARPGQAWTSKDIGSSIGPAEFQGSGSTLMVVGMRQMYLSTDAGANWRLLSHGASVYSGEIPRFYVRPDGSIMAGDSRAGYRESTDLATFHTPSESDVNTPVIGGLFVRGKGASLEVSRDRLHWERFALSAARSLIADSSAP